MTATRSKKKSKRDMAVVLALPLSLSLSGQQGKSLFSSLCWGYGDEESR